jgi:hypothetical protein
MMSVEEQKNERRIGETWREAITKWRRPSRPSTPKIDSYCNTTRVDPQLTLQQSNLWCGWCAGEKTSSSYLDRSSMHKSTIGFVKGWPGWLMWNSLF